MFSTRASAIIIVAAALALIGCDSSTSPSTKAVTGVSLNKSSSSLAVGGTETLVATVAPSDATDQSVSWSSSDASVVSVTSAGLITGLAAGSATITVKTTDGGATASCAVTVAFGTMKASSLAASGATSQPKSIGDIALSLSGALGEDVVSKDVESAVSSIGTAFSTQEFSSGSLAEALYNNYTRVMADLQEALASNKFSDSVDLSGWMLGSYLKATTAKASVNASATTSDGGAIAEDFSNLTGAAASATMNFQFDGVSLPSSSALKALSARLGFSGEASAAGLDLGSLSSMKSAKPFKALRKDSDSAPFSALTYKGNGEFEMGISYKDGSTGMGGKLIVYASVSSPSTTIDSSTVSNLNPEDFYPSMVVLMTVYDDSNNSVFSKKWTDADTLATDIQNSFGSLSLTIQ